MLLPHHGFTILLTENPKVLIEKSVSTLVFTKVLTVFCGEKVSVVFGLFVVAIPNIRYKNVFTRQTLRRLLAIPHPYPNSDNAQPHLTSSLYKIIFTRLKKRKSFFYNKCFQINIGNPNKQKVFFDNYFYNNAVLHKTPINRNFLHIFILSALRITSLH